MASGKSTISIPFRHAVIAAKLAREITVSVALALREAAVDDVDEDVEIEPAAVVGPARGERDIDAVASADVKVDHGRRGRRLLAHDVAARKNHFAALQDRGDLVRTDERARMQARRAGKGDRGDEPRHA